MSVSTIQEYFDTIGSRFRPDRSEGVDALFAYEMAGDGGNRYLVRVKNKTATVVPDSQEPVALKIIANWVDYLEIVNGKRNRMEAAMMGKVKFQGDQNWAMKLAMLFPDDPPR